jgi:hypothetical protein
MIQTFKRRILRQSRFVDFALERSRRGNLRPRISALASDFPVLCQNTRSGPPPDIDLRRSKHSIRGRDPSTRVARVSHEPHFAQDDSSTSFLCQAAAAAAFFFPRATGIFPR